MDLSGLRGDVWCCAATALWFEPGSVWLKGWSVVRCLTLFTVFWNVLQFKTTLGTNEIVDALVRDNEGELSDEHWEADGECVENKHDWTGGTVRSIKLKSMVVA